MTGTAEDRGLGSDGCIRREGSLDQVPPGYRQVVADLREGVAAQFGARLHGAYLYGSIPRGTAVPGRSDLDAVILLCGEPQTGDAAAIAQLAAALDERHEIIDGAGLLCWPVSRILDPAERYDLGFFLACQCC
jgi:uncharacterized protein